MATNEPNQPIDADDQKQTVRQDLLAMVGSWLQGFQCYDANEHDRGDYDMESFVLAGLKPSGEPVRHWTFNGADIESQPYAGQWTQWYFHIDEGNRQVLAVLPNQRRGLAYILHLDDGTATEVLRAN